MRGKENKGITLIALVITIIVLLILAGVTIITLTGQNGILTKTNQAKKETTRATAEEKVNIAVLGSYGKDGRLNYQELQNNLNEVEGIDKQTIPNPITAESFPFTVTVDGVEVKITADGEVSLALAFNAEEWDKTATPEDCFQWGSNTRGQDGYDVIIGYTEKLQSYSKVKIPSRCKKIICDGTYYPNNSYSNDQIGRAFFSNVEKVELPNTVVEIGTYAFGKRSDSITSSLQEITIPDSVTSIGGSAFSSCSNLSSITIPDSVTSIGGSAFSSCSNLSSIRIPDSVTSIGGSAFSDTEWYNSQPDGLVYAGKVAYKYKGEMPENTSIEIKEGTKEISGSAFLDCTGLNSVTIPDSVISIGVDAFSGTAWYNSQPEGVVYAGKVAYEYKVTMSENTSIEIKEGTKGIADNAFFFHTGLSSITIPNSVISIGKEAFYNCTGLSSIIIPNSVTSIGEYAFRNWTEDQTINCRASGKPEGWDENWNYGCDANIVYGYKGE